MRASAAPSHVYVPALGGRGAELEFDPEEAHYLARVCRVSPGDVVAATNGAGLIGTLEILAVGRQVRARTIATEQVERSSQAWVWCGAPEGQRADWLVEKLAELGVSRLQPIQCERAEWRTDRTERWRSLAIAGLRQSRRAHLLEIEQPRSLEAALATLPKGARCWLADENGSALPTPPVRIGLAVGAVGPAAGFGAREVGVLSEAGFEKLRLADGRLRSETAALAWASWWALAHA